MKAVKFALLLLILFSGITFSVVTYRYLHEQNLVDDCLSDKHGSFDYSTMTCDLENNHAYIPYEKRHPHDESVALVAIGAIVILLPIYIFLRYRTNAGGAHAKTGDRD